MAWCKVTVNLAIRGFAGRDRKFEELVSIEDEDFDRFIPHLARKHARALAAHELHMIEIEFLDEPDVNERYFRFGTDPAGMVRPFKVDLRPS